MDLTNEISDAISNPVGMGNQVDEVCLTLCLSVALAGTDSCRMSSRRSSRLWSKRNWTTDLQVQSAHRSMLLPHQSASPPDVNVSLHQGPSCDREDAHPSGVAQKTEEDDEEAQLRQLQAELAM